MKKSRLLLTTALATSVIVLAACDDKTATGERVSWIDALKTFVTGKVPDKYLVDPMSDEVMQQVFGQYQRDTMTGNYLAGRFAQGHFDWPTASTYFSATLKEDPGNIDLQRRAMVLAMGAGKYDEAMTYARSVAKGGDRGSLPLLFLAIEQLKKSQYAEVQAATAQIPNDGISEFIKPLLKAWTATALKRADVAELNKNIVHYYHAILIADFVGDKAALQQLSQRNYAALGLSGKTLDRIADIFEKNGLTAPAQELRKSIPAGLAREISKETEISPRTDEIKTPQQGMARAFFDMASILYQDFPDSARLFAELSLYLEPRENDARILLAHMAAQFQRYDEAIQILQTVDESNDPELQVRIERQIADLLEQSGKTDKSIRVLRDIVAKTKDVDAQIQIGDVYREQEKFDEALAEYNKAFDMLDGDVPTKYWNLFYARGITYERLKKWDNAEKDLKSALALEPDHPYILNYLGYSWADQGLHLDEATKMIEKAVKLRPEDGFIVDSLGWVYFRTGKYPQAVPMLERAVELSPYDPTINDHLGDAYWRVGRRNEARFQWRRASSFEPEAELAKQLADKLENGLPDVESPNVESRGVESPGVENKAGQ